MKHHSKISAVKEFKNKLIKIWFLLVSTAGMFKKKSELKLLLPHGSATSARIVL